MMRKAPWSRAAVASLVAVGLLGWLPRADAAPANTPERELSFAESDAATMERLLWSGSLLLVRQNPDGSLKEVLAGGLANAPFDLAWAAITDFDPYPQSLTAVSAATGLLVIKAVEAEVEKRAQAASPGL